MQTEPETVDCVHCQRNISAGAKLCPFCGANPVTGERVDTTPLLAQHFNPKPELAPTESFLEFFRKRQSLVLFGVVAAIFAVAVGAHEFMQRRAAATASDVPAIPLTEVADLSNQDARERELPLPELDFAYEGTPKSFRTFVMEPGAVAPAPPPPPPGTTPAPGVPPAAGAQAAPARPVAVAPVRPPAAQPTRPPASGTVRP